MSSVHLPSQREVFRAIHKHGWRVEQHRGHYRCISPSGDLVVVSVSSSDRRAIHRVLRDFRRRGVAL
jgi:predicted RNA binding protein YcfA (HicA-like mRNA interferase family)